MISSSFHNSMIVKKGEIEYNKGPLKTTSSKKIMSNCLLEAALTRKNKISLTDYDYLKDIQNRLLISKLTAEELLILEEILYSSLRTPIEKLAKNLDISKDSLLPALEKLSASDLFTLEKDTIVINKEMRKYFELELQKFEEDFLPGMEFLQNLLKKVPIHALPVWYAISRTSNNIFDSIVEKSLETPQTFLRYIGELNFGEPILKQIIDDVQNSEELALPSSYFIEKYNITKELFEEYMLHLEFSFVCCIGHKKINGVWEEYVTLFHEWAEYLRFLRKTDVTPISEKASVLCKRPRDFSFVEDLAVLIKAAKSSPIQLEASSEGFLIPSEQFIESLPFIDLSKDPTIYKPYINHLIKKLSFVKLANIIANKLEASETSDSWLTMTPDNQSLYLYRHPLNKLINGTLSSYKHTEKAMREAEKSIVRVLDKDWVLFDDFFAGLLASLTPESTVSLKRSGRHWKYSLPKSTEEEEDFFRSVVLDWLFEAGIVQVGTFKEKECFRVTDLGKTLFGR